MTSQRNKRNTIISWMAAAALKANRKERKSWSCLFSLSAWPFFSPATSVALRGNVLSFFKRGERGRQALGPCSLPDLLQSSTASAPHVALAGWDPSWASPGAMHYTARYNLPPPLWLPPSTNTRLTVTTRNLGLCCSTRRSFHKAPCLCQGRKCPSCVCGNYGQDCRFSGVMFLHAASSRAVLGSQRRSGC